MARAVYIGFALDEEGRPISGATVDVFNPGTTTPISETIFANDTPDGTTLSNPLTTPSDGKILFFLDATKRVDLRIAKTGHTTRTVPAVVMGLDVAGGAHQNTHETGGTDVIDGIMDANGRVVIQADNSAVGTRRKITFNESANVMLTIVDDSANERVAVTPNLKFLAESANYVVQKVAPEIGGSPVRYRGFRTSDGVEVSNHASDAGIVINACFTDGGDHTVVKVKGDMQYDTKTAIVMAGISQFLIGDNPMGHDSDTSHTGEPAMGNVIAAVTGFSTTSTMVELQGSGSGVFGLHLDGHDIAKRVLQFATTSWGCTASHSAIYGGTERTMSVQAPATPGTNGWRHNLIALRIDGEDHPSEAVLYADGADHLITHIQIQGPGTDGVCFENHANGCEITNFHPTAWSGAHDNVVFDGAIDNCVSNWYVDTCGNNTTAGAKSTCLRMTGGSSRNNFSNIFLVNPNANNLAAITMQVDGGGAGAKANTFEGITIRQSSPNFQWEYAVKFENADGTTPSNFNSFLGSSWHIRSMDVLNTTNKTLTAADAVEGTIRIDHYNYANAGDFPLTDPGTYSTSPLKLHANDASKHPGTRTRTLFLAPTVFQLDTVNGSPLAARGNLGATPNFVNVITFSDATRSAVYFNWMVPADWNGGAITVQYVHRSSAGSGVIRYLTSLSELAAGDNATETSSYAAQVDEFTFANTNVRYDNLAATFTPVGAGNVVKMNIERDGAHANDTNTGNAHLLGVKLSYTAVV